MTRPTAEQRDAIRAREKVEQWKAEVERVVTAFKAASGGFFVQTLGEGQIVELARIAVNTVTTQHAHPGVIHSHENGNEDHNHPEQTDPTRDELCPHGLHFNGYYCDDCAEGRE